MESFKKWLMKEMAGTSTIVRKSDCNNPDFQVWGSFCGTPKTKPDTPPKKKK